MIADRDHPSYIQPDENEVIWRYIDINKFESLLENRALFFCRADRFSDPFEGSIPKKEADFRIFERERLAEYYGNKFDLKAAKKSIEAISLLHKKFKRADVINCWHRNSNESDAMWRLYLKTNEGLAIKSTVKNLINSFNHTSEAIGISNVRYIDYNNNIWFDKDYYPSYAYNFITPLVHKRTEFKHEKELRLIHHIEDAVHKEEYWLGQKYENGKMIKTDVNSLIEEVILPPTADEYIKEKIEDVLSKFDINKPLRKSKLQDKPIY